MPCSAWSKKRAVLPGGVHMRVVLLQDRERVHPQVIPFHANCEEDGDSDFYLPSTVQALLCACCSHHDFGMPGVCGSITIAAAQSEPGWKRGWEQRSHIYAIEMKSADTCVATTFSIGGVGRILDFMASA